MALIRSLLSWIPLVSFESDQEKRLSLDNIERETIETASYPEPSEGVYELMHIIVSGDRPEHEDIRGLPLSLESHARDLRGWQLYQALNEFKIKVLNTNQVKDYIDSRTEQNKQNRSTLKKSPFKWLLVSIFFFASAIFVGLIGFDPQTRIAPPVFLVGAIVLGLGLCNLIMHAERPCHYEKKTSWNSYDGHPGGRVKRKIDAIQETIPDVDVMVHEVNSGERLAIVKHGNAELYLDAWHDEEES